MIYRHHFSCAGAHISAPQRGATVPQFAGDCIPPVAASPPNSTPPGGSLRVPPPASRRLPPCYCFQRGKEKFFNLAAGWEAVWHVCAGRAAVGNTCGQYLWAAKLSSRFVQQVCPAATHAGGRRPACTCPRPRGAGGTPAELPCFSKV